MGNLSLPDVIRCDHLIRFENFVRTIEDFRRGLKPGGLLAVQHSNFRGAILQRLATSKQCCGP
jgi:hypothetical protein